MPKKKYPTREDINKLTDALINSIKNKAMHYEPILIQSDGDTITLERPTLDGEPIPDHLIPYHLDKFLVKGELKSNGFKKGDILHIAFKQR